MEGRTYIGELSKHVSETVKIAGWVDVRRDQGKMIFFDFRDATGYVQGVVLPNATDAHEVGSKVRSEWVVEVHGKVNKRPEKNIQPDKQNGDVELEIEKIVVLNEAENLPIDVSSDGLNISEDVRLKYRYLDLRRPRLQKNIRMRDEVITFLRDYMHKHNFVEIETPILTKGTPEGAREYLVPSRLEKGNFYALPQSPQQFKQLAMVAGFEKYFQIARCMRDEDLRGDRQPEFTQFDLEMSFVEREDVMRLNEELLIALVATVAPEKKIQEIPFPRISYKDAMEQYGTDRPDMRNDKQDPNLFAFCWVIDFPFFEKTDSGGWTFTHNPFSAAKPEFSEDLLTKKNISEIVTTQYDVVLNGFEIGGGSIRNHKAEALEAVLEIMGFEKERIHANFGHMLQAFKYGTPPHGGIAWGLDRFVMLLAGEPNIREVIAFPKTGEGKDLMMGSPSSASPEQLKELGITLIKQ